MTEQRVRWQCPSCGAISTEAELNNQLRCPRCGLEQLTLILETEEYSFDRHWADRERVLV